MDLYAKRISRRTMLRGAGAALALPWLEIMTPLSRAGTTDTQESPVRMAVLFMPNGVRADQWDPEGTGTDFKLSPTLAPLEPLKDQLLVLGNLQNVASFTGDGHYVKTSGFLTGTTITKTVGYDLNANGISMDQLAAQHVGKQTPLPSLELGTEPVSSGVDGNVGYTRVYGSHIAWKSPTNPLAKEIDPQQVFDRLLRAGKRGGSGAASDQLLLNHVLDEARQLRKKLGISDRSRLDEYLESVHSVESRLARFSNESSNIWKPKAEIDPAKAPPVIPKAHEEHVRLMLDMIVLAFQTDTTRISTFMFGNSVSNKDFSFVDGVKGAHHSISHHMNNEEQLRQYQLINRWHVEQYVYLLDRLRNIQEGEKNLLDQSMILFGSGLRDGNSHSPRDLPIVLAGGAGGRLRTGQYVRPKDSAPLCNLYLSMLQAMQVPVDRFADSTGAIMEILA